MPVVNLFEPAKINTAVTVNGVEIPESVISAEMEEFTSQNRTLAWQQAATALVLKELLLQQAQAEGLKGNEEELIEALLSQHIQVPTAEETHCLRFFQENPNKFFSPTLIEARHILLAAAPDDAEARTQARFEAARIIEELQADISRFAEYASTYSACPSREQGGSLGQISKGATVTEFEEPLFDLQPGLAADAIETRYGLHVVWVENRVEGQALPYEHVKEGIARYLEDSAFRRGISQYLQLLAGSSVITGVNIKAADSPLLQ